MHPIAICLMIHLAGQVTSGARILGLFPVPAKSHLMVTSSVMHALAKKGHDVTTFVPFHTDFKGPNYREIVYEHTPFMHDQTEFIAKLRKNFLIRHLAFYEFGTVTTEAALNTSAAKALLLTEDKYDLVILEQFTNEAFAVIARKFKCPLVLISTFGTTFTIAKIFGNPAPYSYVPSEFQALGDRMTFLERVQNVLTILYADLSRKYYYMPQQQALAEKYLSVPGTTIPPLEDIENQADFILISSHHAFSTPRPYMPNMKDVAGMHLKPSKPLPADLQQYLDSSKNGFILFSFGSIVQSALMPEYVIKSLKEAFRRLPYNVIWKWENDTMTDKPKNVRLEKWLPQNDVLAHPNAKLFVTHGGLSSVMETVYHGVPIVGIPVFGDQKRNILLAQLKGYAEHLDYDTLTENEAYDKMMKVASSPEYRDNVKRVSAYWKDEMNHPLDEAVHWVEYVLKHGGAKHLRAAVTEQNFIQYFLLDVGFAALLTLALIYFLISKTFRFLWKKASAKKTAKKMN